MALGYVGRAVTTGETLIVAGGPGRARTSRGQAPSFLDRRGVSQVEGRRHREAGPSPDAVGAGKVVRRHGHVRLCGPRVARRHDRHGVAGGQAGFSCSSRGPRHRAAGGHLRGHRQLLVRRSGACPPRDKADDHAGRHDRRSRRHGDHPVARPVGVRLVRHRHRYRRRVPGQCRQHGRRPGPAQPAAQHAARLLRRGDHHRPVGHHRRAPGRVLAAWLWGALSRRAAHGGRVVAGGPPAGGAGAPGGGAGRGGPRRGARALGPWPRGRWPRRCRPGLGSGDRPRPDRHCPVAAWP